MDKAGGIGKVARRMAEAFLKFCCSPVVLVIQVTDHVVVKSRAGRNYIVNPFSPTVSLEVSGTREPGPFLATAPGQWCTLPFAQPGRGKRGQQITHIPVVIIAPRLLKGTDVFEGYQLLPLMLAPIQAMDSTRNIFRYGNVGSTERSGRFDENAIYVEENGIKARRKLEV